MKFTLSNTLVLALAALQVAFAHTVFTTLFINEVNQGDGACLRMPMFSNNYSNPVASEPLSVEMACGMGGNTPAARTCPAPSGSTLTFTWRYHADGSAPGVIDPSHKGPCAIYMKNVESPMVPPNGDSWFKIWDEGYDNTTNKWCTEKLIDNNGLLSVKVPSTLAGGYYLVRAELLALHNAEKTPPDPQFYVGCAQIFLGPPARGDGVSPVAKVSIPGYLQPDEPSLVFNIYNPKWPYTMPGPMPFVDGHSVANTIPNVINQTIGLLPANAIITNANWWAPS